MKKNLVIAVLILFIFFIFGNFIGQYAFQKTGVQMHLYQVALREKKADPSVINVVVNDAVQFNTKDGKKHIIAQGAGDAYGESHQHDSGIESKEFGKDEAYKVIFRKVGIFEFHDHLNPSIAITVIVSKTLPSTK